MKKKQRINNKYYQDKDIKLNSKSDPFPFVSKSRLNIKPLGQPNNPTNWSQYTSIMKFCGPNLKPFSFAPFSLLEQ